MPPLLNRQNFSQGVWAHAPVLENLFDPTLCSFLNEDWQDYETSSGPYTLTQATTGTAAIDTTAPGRLLIDAGATTANEGANLQRLKSAWVPAAGKSLWAEWLLTLTATSPPVTKAQLFVGLAASDTTIIASGAMTTNNRLGFEILAGGLLQTTITADKAGASTSQTGPLLVDNAPTKLGLHYHGGSDTVQFYVNGAPFGAPITTTNIPKVVVYPSWVCQSDGTDRPNLYLSAYQIMQLR